MATKKKTEKPRKFPWEKPNGKLVDDLRLVTSINELIWRSFDEKGKCTKRPVFNRIGQVGEAVFHARPGLLPKCWIMPLDTYRHCIRVLCTDAEKSKRIIFKRTTRRRGKGEITNKLYEYERYLWEMGLEAELLFVGMVDQSKNMACPECGCYAIFRIPGTNRCIVVLLYGDARAFDSTELEYLGDGWR